MALANSENVQSKQKYCDIEKACLTEWGISKKERKEWIGE
jgi:hypothetical protein